MKNKSIQPNSKTKMVMPCRITCTVSRRFSKEENGTLSSPFAASSLFPCS
jgi:hypothetical protein